jgi:hypothetical protein
MQGEIEHVDADVDGRAAAGAGFVDEREAAVPAGDEAAAHEVGTGVVDVAEDAGIDDFFEFERFIFEALMLGGHQDFLGFVFGGDHFFDELRRGRERLFAQHVAAGVEGVDGDRGVVHVGDADIDHIKRFGFEHLLVRLVAAGFGNAVLIAAAFEGGGGDVADGDDGAIGIDLLPALEVEFRDAAAADEADFEAWIDH